MDLVGAPGILWVCGVQLCFCHFPIGILGQVWYLIVSIPDLCTRTYYFILSIAIIIFSSIIEMVFTLSVNRLSSHCGSGVDSSFLKKLAKYTPQNN